jgi:hypothetical protein
MIDTSETKNIDFDTTIALPNLHIKHVYTQFPLMRDTPFIGRPKQSIEGAWSNLFRNMSLRVSDAELEHQSRTSIKLPEGGNIAWLGVFHELHCIVRKT